MSSPCRLRENVEPRRERRLLSKSQRRKLTEELTLRCCVSYVSSLVAFLKPEKITLYLLGMQIPWPRIARCSPRSLISWQPQALDKGLCGRNQGANRSPAYATNREPNQCGNSARRSSQKAVIRPGGRADAGPNGRAGHQTDHRMGATLGPGRRRDAGYVFAFD